MPTREEVEKLNPDQSYWIGFHSVHNDEFAWQSEVINILLGLVGSRKRAKVVIHEDAIRASGIWTQEEAGEVANRLIIGPDGNFFDPKMKKGFPRLLQYFGFIR